MQESIFNILADKGAVFVVLAVAVWYLHNQNKQLGKKQDEMQSKMMQLIFEELSKTREIIARNTAAFEEMSEYLKKK